MLSLLDLSCNEITKCSANFNLTLLPKCVKVKVDEIDIQNNYDKYNPKCFVSPAIEVLEEDITKFTDLYSIEKDFENDNLIYWLTGIYKTIVDKEIDQGNAYIAISKDLMKLLGLTNRYWEHTKSSLELDPVIYLNKFIICDHSMFLEKEIRDLVIVNPMQSKDECVMVKCGYFNVCIHNICRKTNNWTNMIKTVLDFDVKLVGKPTSIIPREKMVLQMFQCEPWYDSVLSYFKNHHMVVDVINNSYGIITMLLNSEKELTVEQLCGPELSHHRNSYTDVEDYYDGMSMVHIPNISMNPVHDCFFLNQTEYDDDHLDFRSEYNIIARSQFQNKEVNQILIWLVGLRELFRHRLEEKEEGDDAYVVITKDILYIFRYGFFLNCSSVTSMTFRTSCLSGLRNILTDDHGKKFNKNIIFNQKRIDREGFKGIILNPLNYCPTGSSVFVMPLKNFYTAFRACSYNYDYDFELFRRIVESKDFVIELLSVQKCVFCLTDWNNLFKVNLTEELKDAIYEDVDDIKDILNERMKPASKKRFASNILKERTAHKIKRSQSM